jgi:hypothetical protein
MRISISSYDAANLTSLSDDEAAAEYEQAVQAAYPEADVVIRDGQFSSVVVTTDDGADEETVSMHCRELIGRVWEQLTIDYPVDADA